MNADGKHTALFLCLPKAHSVQCANGTFLRFYEEEEEEEDYFFVINMRCSCFLLYFWHLFDYFKFILFDGLCVCVFELIWPRSLVFVRRKSTRRVFIHFSFSLRSTPNASHYIFISSIRSFVRSFGLPFDSFL